MICLILGILLIAQATVLPAKARMNPALRDLMVTYDGAPVQTAPQQVEVTLPEETVPAETIVEETVV